MSKLIAFCAATALALTSAATAASADAAAVQGQAPVTAARDAEEANILSILDRFEEAFAKRDAAMYASNFAVDAVWENAFGGREIGRDNIERRLAGVYQMFQQADQTIVDRRVHFISDDIAVAVLTKDIVGQRSAGTGTKLPTRRVRNTSVLRREPGGWKVVYFEAADIRTDNTPAR